MDHQMLVLLFQCNQKLNSLGSCGEQLYLAKKQEILQEKIKHMPTKSNAGHSIHSCEPNMVRVVNKEYIDKSFNLMDPNDKTIIETIIADYVLNNEQERAF